VRSCLHRSSGRLGLTQPSGALGSPSHETADQTRGPDATAAAPGAVDLAKNIATTQQQEIDVMTDLLTRI
jgi:hypothetical protein